jgi:hypothetical protein
MNKGLEQSLQEMMEHLFARQSEEMKAGQDKTNTKIEEILAGQKEPSALFRGSRTCKKWDDSLPSTISGLSREFEGWPDGNGGRRGYLRQAFEQNRGHTLRG